MATMHSTDAHPGHIDAAPALGNFTMESRAHFAQAHALATSIVGDGFETFANMNDNLQSDLLWLLACELRRGIHALDAETAQREHARALAIAGENRAGPGALHS